MDIVPKETHVVSVMTQKPLETKAKARDEKGDRLLLHPTRRQNKRRGTKILKRIRKKERSLEKSEIPCRFKFCKNTSCNSGSSRVSKLQV